MAITPEQKVRVLRLGGRSLARFIRFVQRTARVVTEPADMHARLKAEHPIIMAVWHGQFMLSSGADPGGVKVAAMVAKHGDAEVIGEAMAAFGVELIRGAGAGTRTKDRGGAQALRAGVMALKDGATLVMTADVPPGPAREAGSGIIMMARMSGRPIVPVAAASSRFVALNTWSRMTLNLPYSKVAYVAGDPIMVPGDADAAAVERYRKELEVALDQATTRAYELVGRDAREAMPPANAARIGPPMKPGLKLKAYRGLTRAVAPATPLMLKFRERAGKEDPERRDERFGDANVRRPKGCLVWVHAASVGETNAILPLIEAMKAKRQDLTFLLTTGTVTSAGLAERRLGADAIHQYVPLDAPQYVTRFLDHWRPDLAVFTESEIWPNLILETADRRIPLALVNGRLSRRSYNRWRRNKTVAAPLFNRFNVVLAQNPTIARWFGEIGAPHVVTAGNLKIDSPAPPVDARAFDALTIAIGARPRLVAASTHEGEELVIAEAHRKLAQKHEGFLTIIAPRHPERGTGIAEKLKALGLVVAQRSKGELPGARTGVYIADTIGELGTLYKVAPIAFIGGSLIPHGGQNPIEAVRHGAAVLTGPSLHNFPDTFPPLLQRGGAVQVANAEEIAAQVSRLISSPAELDKMRAGATAALAELSGALERTVTALLKFLGETPEAPRGPAP